ncbi:hypothetical protein K1719_004703 [Acacia pycnantha]|nr:hypothetical protein K1719_004703 [Acacia pycnantha]
MTEEKEAQNQMGPWETHQSWGLSNPDDEKLPNMDPPPIIGSSSNNNDPLIVHHNQQVVDEAGFTAQGNDKTTPSFETGHGGIRKRTTTGKTANAGGEGKDGNGAGGGEAAAAGYHDMHIWTERERRKKMRNMFAELHLLLPQLPPKADKSSIVDEAVRYIKTLENILEDLEKKKQERLKQAQQPPADDSSSTTIVYDPSSVTDISSYQGNPCAVSREIFMADHGGSSSIIHSSSTNNNNNLMASTTNAFINTIGTSSTFSSPSLPGGVLNNNKVGFQTWSSSNVVVNISGDQAQFNVCSLKKQGLFTNICTVFEKYRIDVVSAHVSSDDHRCFFMIHALANGGSNRYKEALSAEETFRSAAAEMTMWLS